MDRLVILFSITRRHITQVDLYLSSNFSNAEGTSYVIVYNYIIFHRLQKYQFSRILLMLLLTCYSSIVWNSMKIVLYFLNSEDNYYAITEQHHIPSYVMGDKKYFLHFMIPDITYLNDFLILLEYLEPDTLIYMNLVILFTCFITTFVS